MSVRNLQIQTIVTGLIAAAFLLATVQANPDTTRLADHDQRQCGALSPLFLSLGDAYFDVDDNAETSAASPDEIRHNELLSRLTAMRFSQGSGYRVLCTGSAGQVRAGLHSVSLEDIEARQTRDPSPEPAIFVTAYEYDRPSRRLARETVTISTRPQDLLHLTGRELSSSIRHRQRTRIGSYLEETRVKASYSNDTITIDQSVYVNGTLARWNNWQLVD